MEYPETHKQGIISIENIQSIIPDNVDLNTSNEVTLKGDFGLQVARDGRVWVCINGIAFLRFKP